MALETLTQGPDLASNEMLSLNNKAVFKLFNQRQIPLKLGNAHPDRVRTSSRGFLGMLRVPLLLNPLLRMDDVTSH